MRQSVIARLSDKCKAARHCIITQYFVLAELASSIVKQAPYAFEQEMRKEVGNSLRKNVTHNPSLLRKIDALGIPYEDPLQSGHTLLQSGTVELLLKKKCRDHLVYPFRLALLKLVSQEASGLMAGGDYESALPVAIDAVRQGQRLFRREPAIELFPLYLLAAQASLGLRRTTQSEKFLSLASWLALKEPDEMTNSMHSQLSRLYGQLYTLRGQSQEALQAFAEDVHNCSLDYGPEDVRTSLGYFNLARVFSNTGDDARCHELCKIVVSIWLACLVPWALGLGDGGSELPPESRSTPSCVGDAAAGAVKASDGEESVTILFRNMVWRPCTDAALEDSQLVEIVDMLHRIAGMTESYFGEDSIAAGDAYFALGLAQYRLGDVVGASAGIRKAIGSYKPGARCDTAEQILSQIESG
jgi:tetratricopeptide (TPR) repeat protein